MLVHQKTMFDHCYCIKSFCQFKTLEKCFKKFNFCITYNGKQKHEGFVGLRHPDVTELCSLLCKLLLMTSIFVMAQNVNTVSEKAVHQQHVKCLINTWVCIS